MPPGHLLQGSQVVALWEEYLPPGAIAFRTPSAISFIRLISLLDPCPLTIPISFINPRHMSYHTGKGRNPEGSNGPRNSLTRYGDVSIVNLFSFPYGTQNPMGS